MFRWFKASCPVDPVTKEWIEERLQWLSEQFESSAFADKPVVLPTPEFFPDAYDGSKQSVRRLLNRVCEYMGASSDAMKLKLVDIRQDVLLVNEHGQFLPTVAGTYEEGEQKFIIRIGRTELAQPMGLVGTIAHELAHARLMGEGRIPGDTFDNELLTDLTVIFHGLGIFLANSPRNWDSDYSIWPGTTLKKPEYMTPPMFGYALAHLAWHRGETRPDWMKHLHPSARANMKQGLRFLQETEDSRFRP
jgi:hypothetical protein